MKDLAQTKHTLISTPKTVHWGYLSSELAPVLRIDPGDVVTVETFIPFTPDEYESAGLSSPALLQRVQDVLREVTDRGAAPHVLTGPIYVNTAEPGDTLEVHIKEIDLLLPVGFNIMRYRMGTLPDDFPYECRKLLRVDLENSTCEVASGVTIRLRPFFGIMAVAPPPVLGRISSAPPGIYGGNMDNKELIPGTVLSLPIHVKGALFSTGDGHAAQGDGEVNQTALETALRGKLQFFLRKNRRLKWPRAETPTHFITMGFNQDLDIAAQMAVREAIDFLGEKKGIGPEDAYRIASLGVDLHVTQIVNGVKGIHAMIPKELLKED